MMWIRVLFLLMALGSPDYRQLFHPEYDEAIDFMRSESIDFQVFARLYGHDNRLVAATVFPELIRYNRVRDRLETAAVETIYVRYGSERVNFSIGYFQMKPAFIETLEDYIRAHPQAFTAPYFQQIVAFTADDVQEERRQRVERLKNFRWQLRYIHAVYAVLFQRFPRVAALPPEKALPFCATAYNYGFLRDSADIAHHIEYKGFPYAGRRPVPHYPYADVAAYFLANDYAKVFEQ